MREVSSTSIVKSTVNTLATILFVYCIAPLHIGDFSADRSPPSSDDDQRRGCRDEHGVLDGQGAGVGQRQPARDVTSAYHIRYDVMRRSM